MFNEEKIRLNKLGKYNRLPGREKYKIEINQTLKKLKQREKESKTD
jgi:hypothetical protein